MTRPPKVSIITTAYNPGHFLDLALESAWTQSFEDFELILLDNGCTDGSIDSLVENLDPRCRLDRHEENLGRTPALNRALSMSRGEYVAVLDADDVWHEDHLQLLLEQIDPHEDRVLAGTWCIWIDEFNREFSRTRYPSSKADLCDRMAWQNPFIHSASMYRRAAANKVGGYNEDFKFAHDFDLWLNLVQIGDATVVCEYLTQIRMHATNTSDRPQFSLTRLRDTIQLYSRAAEQFDVSFAARLANRKILADAAMRYGAALRSTGRVAQGLRWSAWSVSQDPLVFVRWMIRKLRARE